MSSPGAAPRLAHGTWARRAHHLGEAGVGGLSPAAVTWFGPARYEPGRPGSEATVQALSGLMEVHGRDAGAPRRLGLEVASVAAGLLAVQGSLAAAIAGLRSSPVPAVHTSVLQAALVLLSHYIVVATGLPDAVPGPPLPAPGPPFASAGGQWFEIETLDAGAWTEFWTALGAGHVDLGRAWTQFLWRYERAACSLPAGLHEATACRSLADLEGVAAQAGVSLVPLREYAGVLSEPGREAAFPAVRALAGPSPARAVATAGGLPLAGIAVVEATSRIQGPLAGMLLRMLGAEVTRVQPPDGDYGRAARTLHRGKAAVALDLGRRSGRDDLVDLVAGADVFLHNWRPGKAAEWGVEPADLVTRRPGLVYAALSGWGERPPTGGPVGTDFLVQAYAGVGQGLHPAGDPPVPSRMVLSDLFGGIVAAEGILAGLYRRERTGQAQVVGSSLLAGAMAAQAHVLDGLAAGAEDGRRGGRPAWGLLDRPVPTADGDLMVRAGDDESFARLCRACGLDRARTSERQIYVRLREGVAADMERELVGAGVDAAAVCGDLATLPADPRVADLFEPVAGGGVAPRSPWGFT